MGTFVGMKPCIIQEIPDVFGFDVGNGADLRQEVLFGRPLDVKKNGRHPGANHQYEEQEICQKSDDADRPHFSISLKRRFAHGNVQSRPFFVKAEVPLSIPKIGLTRNPIF